MLKRASYEGPPPADYSAPTSTWLSFAISPAQPRPAKSSLCSSSPPVLLLPNTHSFLFLSFKPRRRYRSLPSLPFQHAHEEASLPACLCPATLTDWLPPINKEPETNAPTATTTKTNDQDHDRDYDQDHDQDHDQVQLALLQTEEWLPTEYRPCEVE